MKENLSKDEQFAIYWCYNRAMDYIDKHSPLEHPKHLDVMVGEVNITETIRSLLKRLVV